MPLSTATITFDISDQVGTDFDARRTKVWVTTNVPDETVIDTEGNQIRLGSGRGTIDQDGTGSVSVWVPGAGANPASWQTTVHVDYPDTFAPKGRAVRSFGPFTISGDANLADLVAEQEVPAQYLTTVTTTLQGYLDDGADLVDDASGFASQAATARTGAETARDEAQALVLSDLGTTDGQTRALIENPVSQTAGALSATYARAVSLDPALGDGVTDVTAAVQSALNDAAGGQLVIPAGDYRINVTAVPGSDGSDTGLRMLDPGTAIVMHPGATLRALTSSADRYDVIEIMASDCSVSGGKIVGDVGTHIGTTGEFGHGISIREAAHRTRIEGVHISKCWGDGICVGDGAVAYTTGARPADVQINNVVCDDNRRQGVSFIAALRARVNGGAFINTGQTAFTSPGAGIGVEANEGGLQDVTDLVVTGAVCASNVGRGAYFNSAGNELTATLNGVRCVGNEGDGFGFDFAAAVTLNGCLAENNGVGGSFDGYLVPTTQTAPITFNGCVARGNSRMGFITAADDTTFAACRSDDNGWAGFATLGDRTVITGCSASGNNQISNFYGQFMLDGGADAHLVGCVSEAGQGATRAGWGFQLAASVTGAQLSGCTAKGSFTAGPFLDQATGTIALPKPGAAKQTGVAVDAAGIHAALVNLGLITA